MGAFQSKVWSEVASSASPGSPSENGPVGNSRKPAAPFRDPRSVSDGVDRTPIQFLEDKPGKVSSVDKTPTGPSLAGRFKAASSDPRSPGGQGLTRTPILLKTQKHDETMQGKRREDHTPNEKEILIPTQGTDTFVDKLTEQSKTEDTKIGSANINTGTEVKDLSDLISKMDVSSNDQLPTTKEQRAVPNKEETEEINYSKQNDYEEHIEHLNEASKNEITTQSSPLGKSSLESDCRSPLLIEDNDSAVEMNTARCGKKTMFPMTFGYQEAKSPRSPLGTINLNAKFKASPASTRKNNAAGDFRNEKMVVSQNKQDFKPQRLSMENEMGDLLPDQENVATGQNSSLVI